MGCLNSSDDNAQYKSPPREQSTPTAQKKERLQFESKSPHLELPFNVQTPPIINNNKVLFFETSNNVTKYVTLDLSTQSLTTDNPIEIKCDDSFDIFKTVYTLNPSQNKIYFIENNENISTLDLETNSIESLNKTIKTTNGNYAAIKYSKITNKMYIFGAENGSDECEEYINIPYATATKMKGKDISVGRIQKFGQYARVFENKWNESDWIFICGGQKDVGKGQSSTKVPGDQIWHYAITNDKWIDDEKEDWRVQKWQLHYLSLASHSYGVINYENRFLLCFGGEIMKTKGGEVKFEKTNSIYVCGLNKKFIVQIKKENDKTEPVIGEFDLKQDVWYDLGRKLPIRGYWHAVYNKEINKDIVHLFTYDGKYYTLNMKYILDELKIQGVHDKHPWTEQGKTALPTKSKSIKNMGPKGDSDSD